MHLLVAGPHSRCNTTRYVVVKEREEPGDGVVSIQMQALTVCEVVQLRISELQPEPEEGQDPEHVPTPASPSLAVV